MKKIYPISRPYITKDDRNAVLAVLKTDHLSLGPKHKEFEEKFARKIGTKYACSVSSGTAGLHLAMLAAGIGDGDEVITSPLSFIASSNSVMYVGARPVFVDIDPVTYNMDPRKIEAKITKKTKAILAVHIFGQCSEMDQIIRVAKRYNLKLIEDACESILAEYKGCQAGTFGESAVFAFYPNKQMTTAEGGMLVTDDIKIYKLCNSLKNQGRSDNMQWLDHERLGYNYRMDEMSAALGLSQLDKLDFMIQERAKIAATYNKYLEPHAELVKIPMVHPDNKHSWFVYVALIKSKKINRDKIIVDLAKQGISTKPYLPAIHLFSFYKDRFGHKRGDFPVCESISDSSLALPFYIGLQEKDIKYIVAKLVGVLQKNAV